MTTGCGSLLGDPLVLAPKKPPEPPAKLPRRKRIAPAIAKAWAKGLTVSRDDIAAYVPNHVDMIVLEAMLGGATSPQEIADQARVPVERIHGVFRDTVAAGWVAQKLTDSIQHRLGFVVAALFGRATNGDVAAARLLLERYGAILQVSHVVHHSGLDPKKLSDADLRSELKRALLTAGPNLLAPVDAEFTVKGADGGGAPAAPGAGAAAEGGPAPPVATVPGAG